MNVRLRAVEAAFARVDQRLRKTLERALLTAPTSGG